MQTERFEDFIYDRSELLHQPEAAFERLRAAGGISWSPKMRRWIVVAKKVAEEAFRHKELIVPNMAEHFTKAAKLSGHNLTSLVRLSRWIPFVNEGPSHAVARKAFAVTLERIKSDYVGNIEVVDGSLWAPIIHRGHGDFATEYADLLHFEIMGMQMRMSAELRRQLARTAAMQSVAFSFMAGLPELIRANEKMEQFFELLELHTASRDGRIFLDKISDCIPHDRDAPIASDPVGLLAALLLLGGDSLAGTLTLALAEMLDASGGSLCLSDFRNHSNEVDETFRLSSPVQASFRIAASDLTLAGQKIRRGEKVLIFISAANRDPEGFACPHERVGGHPAHIAFGAGRHLCLGMSLSRAVVDVALHNLWRTHRITALPGRLGGESLTARRFSRLPIKLD